MNLNVSLVAGVYDNFDLGDTRVGAALDAIPMFMALAEAYYVLGGERSISPGRQRR